MGNERKFRRAEQFRLSQEKEHLKRRNLGRKKTSTEPLSRAEFEKLFPHLPIKAWYQRQRLTGSQSFYDDYDDYDYDQVIPETNLFLPCPSIC